jgi:protein involved in polysaccharide export with SLBB domain
VGGVLVDGILKDKNMIGNVSIGSVSDALMHKVLAANPARNEQLTQVIAGYSPPSVSPVSVSSPSNAPNHVAADPVAPESTAALSSERPKAINAALEMPSATTGLSFGVGDKLKIAFYERVDVEEDKWARAPSALRSIQLRPELSGEYTVQEDGTVSIPLLGSISVTGRSAQQAHTAMDVAFEHLLGRKGMVNVVLLERAPIYVLGPVKNPGSFKYVPGATVLHAIAMAGGLDRGTNDPWTRVEAVREIQKRRGAAGIVVKLIARDAVLKAERDGTTPKVPLRLIDLVGATEATSLVNEQSNRRKAIAQARRDREQAIMSSVESAKQDLLMYGHTTSLDQLVKTRQERVDNTRGLVERNIVAKSVLSQVEGELSDAEQRRQDAINQYGMAKQRLASLAAEGLKVQADLENDLAVEIEAVERQIADSERELSTSEGILKDLPVTRAAFTSSKEAKGTIFQIVRRTTSGPVNIAADGMTLLQPGDLLNITAGAGQAAGEPSTSSVPMMPDDGLPVGRNASQQTSRTIAQE